MTRLKFLALIFITVVSHGQPSHVKSEEIKSSNVPATKQKRMVFRGSAEEKV
jgi:hypothetical protein